MRIAISATGPTLDADVDPRFGRCHYFLVVDPVTKEFQAIDNADDAGDIERYDAENLNSLGESLSKAISDRVG